MGRRCFVLGAAIVLASQGAAASEVAGAKVVLTRSAGAEDCPDEGAVATELSRRLGASRDRGHKPALVEVRLARDADHYSATIRVEGENAGVRVLRAVGPTCKPLSDALLVALLVLFDANLALDEPSPAPVSAPPMPPKALDSPSSSPSSRSSRKVAELWISAGGAATHGLPLGFGGAVFGDVDARLDRWDLGAGAYWTPERSVSFAPGEVLLRSWGGRVRGCYALTLRAAGARVSGCAWGMVSALHGAGSGFDTTKAQDRVWGLGGLGVDLGLPISSAVALGVQGVMLVSVHREAFSVDRLGTAYETDPIAGWLGADLRVRFW
jgi:hypothetical protein